LILTEKPHIDHTQTSLSQRAKKEPASTAAKRYTRTYTRNSRVDYTTEAIENLSRDPKNALLVKVLKEAQQEVQRRAAFVAAGGKLTTIADLAKDLALASSLPTALTAFGTGSHPNDVNTVPHEELNGAWENNGLTDSETGEITRKGERILSSFMDLAVLLLPGALNASNLLRLGPLLTALQTAPLTNPLEYPELIQYGLTDRVGRITPTGVIVAQRLQTIARDLDVLL
jgi:hypothetical protein